MRAQERLTCLDGYRGVAALVVVVFHGLEPFEAHHGMPHAALAVDFFFMLSAFVIAYAYADRVERGMGVAQFLIVRAIRLYPLHLLGLVLGLLVYVARAGMSGDPGALAAAGLAFVLQLAYLPVPFGLGEGWGAGFPLNVPAWSLSFEWLGNLLWLLVLIRLSRPWLWALAVVVGAAFAIQSLVIGRVGGGATFDTLAWGLLRMGIAFLLGQLIWLWFAGQRPLATEAGRAEARAANPVAPLLGAAVLLAALLIPLWAGGVSRAVYEVLVVVLLFPVLIAAGSRMSLPASHAVSRWFDWMGRLSYPVYVLHYPIVRLYSGAARRLDMPEAMLPVLVLLQVMTVLVVAHLASAWFDEPVRRWLGSLHRRASAQRGLA